MLLKNVVKTVACGASLMLCTVGYGYDSQLDASLYRLLQMNCEAELVASLKRLSLGYSDKNIKHAMCYLDKQMETLSTVLVLLENLKDCYESDACDGFLEEFQQTLRELNDADFLGHNLFAKEGEVEIIPELMAFTDIYEVRKLKIGSSAEALLKAKVLSDLDAELIDLSIAAVTRELADRGAQRNRLKFSYRLSAPEPLEVSPEYCEFENAKEKLLSSLQSPTSMLASSNHVPRIHL